MRSPSTPTIRASSSPGAALYRPVRPRRRRGSPSASTGTYAIAVYHDADSNRSFNRTGIGLPEEGFGFSNNPGTLFGLPSFRSVRLAVPRSDMQTTVRIRYP